MSCKTTQRIHAAEYCEGDERDNNFTPIYEGADPYPDFDLFMNLESEKKIQIISGYFIFEIPDEFIENYSLLQSNRYNMAK